MSFETILNQVRETREWKVMGETVENSPWHREASTQVHTLMTLAKYDEHIAEHRTERQRMLTRVALLWHDFGKPDAEETLTNDDGTTRRRYAGHELISANSFIDFITTYPAIRQSLMDVDIVDSDVRAIRFMIEHHLPYGLKKTAKREALKSNLAHLLGDDLVCFYDMLLSDARGRISDDHEAKLKAVDHWIEEFKQVPVSPVPDLDPYAPVMIIAFGSSGSGKSTWSKKKEDAGTHAVFSLDRERVKFAYTVASDQEKVWLDQLKVADPNGFYDVVYNLAVGDNKSAFKQFAHAEYLKILDARESVIVDNMNIAKKGRAFFIQEARQRGYNVVSVEFLVPLQTIIDRQKTRGDKSVPIFAVRQAYLGLQLPLMASTSTNLKTGKKVLNPEGEVDAYLQIFSF